MHAGLSSKTCFANLNLAFDVELYNCKEKSSFTSMHFRFLLI